jgi:type II secretory pathway pseudopilin PulG
MEPVLTIVLSIIGSSAVFTFIQFLITRKDTKNSKLEELTKEIKSVNENVNTMKDEMHQSIKDLSEKMNENDEKIRQEHLKTVADTRRVRILRGSDEIKLKVRHSEEWFDQTNEDITEYEHYCDEHPGYKNNKAVHAIANINSAYQKALKDNDFL